MRTLTNFCNRVARLARETLFKARFGAGARNPGLSLEQRLVMAAAQGRTRTVEDLLDSGADVHWKSDEALRQATRNGHAETAKLLIEAGADIAAGQERRRSAVEGERSRRGDR
jgi:hypothetical protein